MTQPLWRGLTHQQVYDQVHAGPGPYVSEGAITAWNDAEAALRAIDGDLAAAMAKAGDWEGSAAEATHQGLTPLGAWAVDAAHAAGRAAVSVQQHQEQVANVRAALPEPGPDPDTLSPFSFNGPGTAPREVQAVANTELAAQAFHVMDTYATNTGLIQHWVAPWSAPPNVTVAVAEPAAITSPAGTARGNSTRIAPRAASTVAVGAAGGGAVLPTVDGRSAGAAGGDRQEEAAAGAGAVGGRATGSGLGGGGRAGGGSATDGPAIAATSTAGGAASATPILGGSTTPSPTWRDLPELAHASDAAIPPVFGTGTAGTDGSRGTGAGGTGSLAHDTGSYATPGIGSRSTARPIGTPGPGDGVLRPISDLDALGGSPSASGLSTAPGAGSGWSARQFGDPLVDGGTDWTGRTTGGSGGPGWTGRATGGSGGAALPDGTIDGRTGLLDAAGPGQAGEPGGGTGARSAGAPGYMPMAGGAGGPAGQTHRRPPYLLDDSGAFADNRWFTEAVITPDDPLPSA